MTLNKISEMLLKNAKLQLNEPLEASIRKAFETEFKLVNLFEQMIGHRLDINAGLLREFESADGVADIILFDLFKDHRTALELGGINPRWAFALKSLPYRKLFTTNEFIELTGVSKARAVSALMEYADFGYCVKGSKSHTWKKVKQPRLIAKKIIAIEAKLKDWKRALRQAIRYRDYADQSWVLLDNYSFGPALQNSIHFIEANVGLASINANGIVEIHLTPFELEPKSHIRLWQANAEIARRLKLGL